VLTSLQAGWIALLILTAAAMPLLMLMGALNP
jgi:hypothetical protein